MERLTAVLRSALPALFACSLGVVIGGCAAFNKAMNDADDVIVDISNATAETLACMAQLKSMADANGKSVSQKALLAVCAAITIEKNLPPAPAKPAMQPTLM